MQIINIDDKNLVSITCQVLNNGGLIVYPTETCYGVGVDATNNNAVLKLLNYKKRPEGKAISVALSDVIMAKKYVELNDIALNIYKNFLPGPITVISKILKDNPGEVNLDLASEDGNLGIRIPDYKPILEIIKSFGKPITATSANTSGGKTPYSIEDILGNVGSKQKELIDLVINGGTLPQRPPSTVVDTTKDEMKTIREGSVTFGNKIMESISNNVNETEQVAKDLLKRFKGVLETKCLFVLFNAEMGAGKTVFVKSIATELGVEEIVKSPTYSLIKEYPTKFGKLIHIDAWRIETKKEFEKLNIEKYLVKGNVVAIEWAGGISNEIREKYIKGRNEEIIVIGIDIEYITETSRKITITRI